MKVKVTPTSTVTFLDAGLRALLVAREEARKQGRRPRAVRLIDPR